MSLNKYFLPYQAAWINDNSKIKIAEKSRRIGLTYAQSYEDVRDCVKKTVPAVWFSSADESAAKEYILYCKQWAGIFNTVAEDLGEMVIDEEKGAKALVLEFKNGTRIHALSSNPSGFRSKGGKVVIDEFAFHKDQASLWAAARPCITWGFPLRIISTHNGKNCKYYKFVEDTKKGKLKWSLHTTAIYDAVEQGLADKIMGRKLTDAERQAWIEEEKANCGDDATWSQEYCCIAVDEATAFLTYDLIESCELDNIEKALEQITGDLYVGMDIGRKKDLTVITLNERCEAVNYIRKLKILEKTKFHIQREILYSFLRHKNFRRACIDSTGLGMQLAEEAQKDFGQYRVEPITFTAAVKEELAYGLLRSFQDRNTRIPSTTELREDLHSVKKISTGSGNIRFDVEADATDGHADRFWSVALAVHAAGNSANIPTYIATRGKRKSYERLQTY
nr:hypothetical protein 4 [bacterium]